MFYRKNADGTLTEHPYQPAGHGAKALSDNTAGVVLAADQKAHFVDITVFGGIVSIGVDETVRVDGSNASGIIMTPGSTPYRVYCTNLNQIYVSGASGSRACYIYYL